jgi:hypothetical protein
MEIDIKAFGRRGCAKEDPSRPQPITSSQNPPGDESGQSGTSGGKVQGGTDQSDGEVDWNRDRESECPKYLG